MFGADELQLGYLMPVLETPPPNEQISMYEGSMGPISGKWGVPPRWGLAGQEFEGGGVARLQSRRLACFAGPRANRALPKCPLNVRPIAPREVSKFS